MEKRKYIEDSVLLTKLAFEQRSRQLREEKAKEYGMTLEEWDAAVLNGSVVHPKNDNKTEKQ
jgi:hypothetical protein